MRITRFSVAIVVAVACGDPAVAPNNAIPITVGDDFFLSNHAIVFPGQPVTWTWTGQNPHDVTFDDPAITGSPTQTSGTFTTQFDGVMGATFTYYCTVHGRQLMSGIIELR